MSRSDIILEQPKQPTQGFTTSKMTDDEYFALSSINASTLKAFDSDPYKFYKKYVEEKDEDELEEDEDTDATVLGSAVHCLLLEPPEEFDKRFCQSSVSKPSGQPLQFVDRLLAVTKKYTDENGVVTKTFFEMAEEAYNGLKYDPFTGQIVNFKRDSLEKVIEVFDRGLFKKGEDQPQFIPKLWYDEKRKNEGKKVITLQENSIADKMVETAKNHPFTRNIINQETDKTHEVFNEYIIEGRYLDFDIKAKIDKFIVNKKLKRISVFDVKTSYDNQNFLYNYKKLKYYLQLGIYYELISQLTKQFGKDYLIESFTFLVIDPIHSPLVYETTYDHYLESIFGFTDQYNKKYRGVNQLLKDLDFAKKNNVWRCTREQYENNGRVKLELLGKEKYLEELSSN